MRKRIMSRFSVDFFWSHSAEERPVLCFRKYSVAKNITDKGGGGGGSIKFFPRKNFCLTVLKTFVRELFRVSLISGIEKLYASEGYVTIFRRKKFVSEYRNFS